jgi:hypothetical protein
MQPIVFAPTPAKLRAAGALLLWGVLEFVALQRARLKESRAGLSRSSARR